MLGKAHGSPCWSGPGGIWWIVWGRSVRTGSSPIRYAGFNTDVRPAERHFLAPAAAARYGGAVRDGGGSFVPVVRRRLSEVLMTPTGHRPLRILMLTWEYPPAVIGGLGRHVEG